MAMARVCVSVTGEGTVDPRWGRAERVAVADVDDGIVVGWQEYAVGWDSLHDAGTEGAHHARVARFLREHRVDVVIAEKMGLDMARMLGKLDVVVRLGATGDARTAVQASRAPTPEPSGPPAVP
jgi:predicted Fe-Mo cluster-binding NifX family protein